MPAPKSANVVSGKRGLKRGGNRSRPASDYGSRKQRPFQNRNLGEVDGANLGANHPTNQHLPPDFITFSPLKTHGDWGSRSQYWASTPEIWGGMLIYFRRLTAIPRSP